MLIFCDLRIVLACIRNWLENFKLLGFHNLSHDLKMKELDKVSLRKCPVGVLVCGFADVFLLTYLFMCLTLHVLF